ncbi:hypothetical protein XPA_000898 [Xanthoria parietina]
MLGSQLSPPSRNLAARPATPPAPMKSIPVKQRAMPWNHVHSTAFVGLHPFSHHLFSLHLTSPVVPAALCRSQPSLYDNRCLGKVLLAQSSIPSAVLSLLLPKSSSLIVCSVRSFGRRPSSFHLSPHNVNSPMNESDP